MRKIYQLFLGVFFLLALFISSISVVRAECPSECWSAPQQIRCTIPQCRDCCQPQQVRPTGEIYNPALPPNLSNMTGIGFLQSALTTAVTLAFVIGSLVFFFMLITGGIKWIFSGGDKAQLEGAQKQLSSALIGLFILFLIFAIINLIDAIFGINLLNITLPTL